MRLQSTCFVLGAVLALTAPAWAQSKAIPPTGISTGTQATGMSTGAFHNLSPGGQRIAQSLYNAQNPSSGTTKLTLDQIAGMKGREGWGRVFKEMKSDGLVQAKNLGQVVSGHAQMTSTGTAGTTGRGSQTSTRAGGRNSTATHGAGRSMRFASAGGHGGGHFAGGYSAHYMGGGGMYAGGMAGGGFAGGGFHGGGGGGHGRGH